MVKRLNWRLVVGIVALALLALGPVPQANADWSCSPYACDAWGQCCSVCVNIDGCGDIRDFDVACF